MSTISTTIVPAPSSLPESFFIHGLSGRLIPVVVVAFRISDEGAVPVEWPALEGPHWQRAEQLGDGQWAAHGRTGRNPQDLATGIRVKRPQ
jgi:hypothetical protein